MQGLGSLLFIGGVGSILLNLLSMEFMLLMWVDMWGPTVGWIIRIAMIVVGALLWGAGAMLDQGGGDE